MNENNIIPFIYEDRPVRVILDEQNDPWWVAMDVCNILGLVNARKAIAALDDDEKKTLPVLPNSVTASYAIPSQRGNPNINIINEPGLYTLIIRSDKPKARLFRRWITHEVLPAIRKTGSYAVSRPETGAENGDETENRQIPDHVWQKTRAAGQSVRPGNRIKLLNLACQMNRLDQTTVATRAGILLDYAELCQNILMAPEAPGDTLENCMGDFINACCREAPGVKVQAADIYARFIEWYHESISDETPSATWFGRELAQRFRKTKSMGVIMYHGIGLADEEMAS